MEDTLSFEDMAIECKPFEPSYTEEFRQYMQKSIEESRKARAEAIRSMPNIIGNATGITYRDMLDLWEQRHKELMALSKEELVEIIIGPKEKVGCTFG